jgi:hypothetical protein
MENEMTTLKALLAGVTAEHLGTEADELDVEAYRDALAEAWPTEDEDAEVDIETAERIGTQVMGGDAGRIDGLSWALIANAQRQGIEAAQTFADENPESVEGALEPGQLGADEALISAMGVTKTAEFFGVEPGTVFFSAACREYNTAFDAELRRLAPGVVANARNRAAAEKEALDEQG